MGDNSCKRDISQAQQQVANSQPESSLAYTSSERLRINPGRLGAGNFVRLADPKWFSYAAGSLKRRPKRYNY